MSSQVWWYAARSAGLVAWVLLAASVLLGLAMSTRRHPGTVGRPWLLDLHRFVGGLAVVFVGVHIAALIADSYVHLALVDVLVPFASSWRPGAVAWGVVGFWLLLAVEVTSLLRRLLPKRVWRRVHFLSFPLYAVASLHFLQAGTEGTTAFMRLLVLGVSAVVAALSADRVARLLGSHDRNLPSPRADAIPQDGARRRDVVVVAGSALQEKGHVR